MKRLLLCLCAGLPAWLGAQSLTWSAPIASASPTLISPMSGPTSVRGIVSDFLPNGMQVIVKADRRAPTAVHMVWVRVGSIDEVDGKSGIAHVLEHMLFKGTETLAPGEF